jgi:hypothetical protein
MLLHCRRTIEDSFEHPFAISMILASVILLQQVRFIDVSCGHPFAISMILASVILLLLKNLGGNPTASHHFVSFVESLHDSFVIHCPIEHNHDLLMRVKSLFVQMAYVHHQIQ